MAELTVLMPVGNQRRFLRESLTSVIHDTRGRARVLIVFHGEAPRRTLLHGMRDLLAFAEHRTLPASLSFSDILNEAIQGIKTPLIARMDADDVWLPGRMMHHINVMRDNPDAIMSSAAAEIIDSRGNPIGKYRVRARTLSEVNRQLLWRNPIIHPTVVMRTAACLDVGGYPNIERAEDYGLWLRMAARGRLLQSPHSAILYRLHVSQATRASLSGIAVKQLRQEKLRLAEALDVRRSWAEAQHAAWLLAQQPAMRFTKRCWTRARV